MPHDVLDHDDGVVDDEADRDRQSHQREVTETVAEFVQYSEGTDQRQRYGDGRNNGGPEIAQEYEDHHHDQCDRQHQRELHVADRSEDGLGAVGDDVDLDRGRDRGLEHRHHRLDPVHRVDNVGAGLALDRQEDRPLLVVPARYQIVLRRTDSAADIAYADRRSVAIGDHQIGVVVGLQQLIVGVERVGLAWAVERAFRQIDIRLAERRPHVLEVDAAGCQSLRIELYADGGLLLTADTHQTDAGYLRYFLQQNIFGVSVDGGQWQGVGGEAQHKDWRVSRIDLPDCRWIRHAHRQVRGRSIDRRQRVAHRTIHLAVPIELQGDLGVAECARRRHLGEARDLAELQFEWRRHRRRHGLRIGAWQLGRDLKCRVIDVRQRRHRQ